MSNLPEPRPDDKLEVSVEQALEMMRVGQEMSQDLALALTLIKKYQRNLDMLASPDPERTTANELLRKHGQPVEKMSNMFRIFVGTVDITEHPDSMEGTAVEEDLLELEEAEEDNPYSDCPYLLQDGSMGRYGPNTCIYGCTDEPRCSV